MSPRDPRSAEVLLDHHQVSLSEWAGVEVFRSRIGPGTFREHEHAEIQVSVRVARPEDGSHQPSSSSLSIIESGRPHAGELSHRAEFALAYLEPDALEADAFDLTGQSSVQVRSSEGAQDDWLAAALTVIYEELRSEETSTTVAEALGHSVRTRILAEHSSVSPPSWARVRPLAPGQLRDACGLLAESLSEKTRVTDIAEYLGFGTSRFAKAFRASVGVPPYAYLMLQRARRAEELLATTAMPLASVAYTCGYASQSHMTEQFKRKTGKTPSQYRRAVQRT